MSPSRLAAVLVLLSSCAAWETATPNYTAPPAEGPTPSSHYAPPPPATPDPPTETPDPPTEAPPKGPPGDHIAIASVQLSSDCPDPPAPAAANMPSPAASRQRTGPAGLQSQAQSQSQSGKRRASDCDQSTVQIGVRSDRPGKFRVEAVRILDGARQRVAGTSTLRLPTQWIGASSTYEAWDEGVVAETDLQISYKLGELDLTKGERLVGREFNTFFGPFLLELDVSIDGRRQTIRSSQFAREMPDMAIQT